VVNYLHRARGIFSPVLGPVLTFSLGLRMCLGLRYHDEKTYMESPDSLLEQICAVKDGLAMNEVGTLSVGLSLGEITTSDLECCLHTSVFGKHIHSVTEQQQFYISMLYTFCCNRKSVNLNER